MSWFYVRDAWASAVDAAAAGLSRHARFLLIISQRDAQIATKWRCLELSDVILNIAFI